MKKTKYRLIYIEKISRKNNDKHHMLKLEKTNTCACLVNKSLTETNGHARCLLPKFRCYSMAKLKIFLAGEFFSHVIILKIYQIK